MIFGGGGVGMRRAQHISPIIARQLLEEGLRNPRIPSPTAIKNVYTVIST